jgi:hypothetical protein
VAQVVGRGPVPQTKALKFQMIKWKIKFNGPQWS